METELIPWNKVRKWDDIFSEDEKEKISELEKESKNRCPHLKKEGNFFHYCIIGLSKSEIEDKRIRPYSRIYGRQCNIDYLCRYCMNDFKSCPSNLE